MSGVACFRGAKRSLPPPNAADGPLLCAAFFAAPKLDAMGASSSLRGWLRGVCGFAPHADVSLFAPPPKPAFPAADLLKDFLEAAAPMVPVVTSYDIDDEPCDFSVAKRPDCEEKAADFPDALAPFAKVLGAV